MQTTAMGTVANSLPKNEIILLTLLISDWYIPYTDLREITGIRKPSKLPLFLGSHFFYIFTDIR